MWFPFNRSWFYGTWTLQRRLFVHQLRGSCLHFILYNNRMWTVGFYGSTFFIRTLSNRYVFFVGCGRSYRALICAILFSGQWRFFNPVIDKLDLLWCPFWRRGFMCLLSFIFLRNMVWVFRGTNKELHGVVLNSIFLVKWVSTARGKFNLHAA